ncbi:5-methylcytosine rRNA methyltransferase NSUN4 [Copidosoma floridanum]|uniref:5-methylcytosine rRNA methyltransferase NSUN4 n=1 Tax=Copidosoma floridanum TaxID=29053 RepID=UPI000C6FB32F|nr:5-methylcytosine rRNA methyltransferase NSUN4 [Copidosoma floridanum]
MAQLFKNVKLHNVLFIPVRYRNPQHHWSEVKKKVTCTQRALDHFDDFYEKVYGESWKHIRSAMLAKNHKYVAVVNNFSDTERTCSELENLGAMSLKSVYDSVKRSIDYEKSLVRPKGYQETIRLMNEKLGNIVEEQKKNVTSVYTDPSDDHTQNVIEKESENDNSSFEPVKLKSIETDLKVVTSKDRIISPACAESSSFLYEYVPATKLKGMEDFVLESEHYNYYTQGADFRIKIEKENDMNFPDHLLLYTFEEGNNTKFPKPKTGSTDLLDYFVLDGASVLPILSLDLQPGDKFLDMCAAPGGKTMMALQTLRLRLAVANDIQESRINRINTFIHEFLLEKYCDKSFYITQSDARHIEDNGVYNKILVDVPCTTDRHVLHEFDNNIFKGSRIKERLRLPELQSEILVNALKLAIPGGTVVYSTCTLSPIQNDGVVQMALKKAFEEHNVVYKVIDQMDALVPLKYLYNFNDSALKYGHIVVPSKSRNWGPMYFCKMIRIQ